MLGGGLQDGELVILAARPGCGKAQPLDALLKTPTGWTDMASVKVGDRLASPDGEFNIVTGVHPRGVMETYMVTFGDGRQVECSGDLICGRQRSADRWWEFDLPRSVATEKLSKYMKAKRYQRRVSVPLIDGNGGKPDPLPIDPYVLGLLIGDGAGTTASTHYT